MDESSDPLQRRAVRAVFLDAGGTLIHLDRTFVLDALAARGLHRTESHFIAADAAARRHIGELIRSGAPSDDASRWAAYGAMLLHELGCNGEDAGIVRRLVMQRHADGMLWSWTADGTAEALRRIRTEGYALGVVSNADGRVARFLEHAGLAPYLDFVIDSGVVGVEKPDPRIFALACAAAGVAPDEAVHVGDVYEIDVVGARAAGIRPLLIDPDGLHATADCERITAITELPDWLAGVLC